MRNLGVMTANGSDSYRRGHEVVVRTERGTETGQVLCEASEDALSHLDEPSTGNILREFGDQDAADLATIEAGRDQLMKDVTKEVAKLGLDMQLVDTEQILGRQRLVIYYLAEQRVDFRELVKVLAKQFSTRIEMRQIGVRDEAKLLADYGDCGKPVCCNTHLVKMPPVSMKMAKLQKATLDPTKISGRCGRLKCCLRYEFETYDEIQKSLPNIGSQIVTRNGKAKVIAQQLLAQQLLIETEDHRRMLIEASEVLSVIEKPAAKKKKKKPKKKKPKNKQKPKSD
jgi:cell fate regulator YaaT (PSP1 superfamily)